MVPQQVLPAAVGVPEELAASVDQAFVHLLGGGERLEQRVVALEQMAVEEASRVQRASTLAAHELVARQHMRLPLGRAALAHEAAAIETAHERLRPISTAVAIALFEWSEIRRGLRQATSHEVAEHVAVFEQAVPRWIVVQSADAVARIDHDSLHGTLRSRELERHGIGRGSRREFIREMRRCCGG